MVVAGYGEEVNGLGIRDVLAEYYGRRVPHPRIYTNLSLLVEEGLLRVRDYADGKGFQLTAKGKRHIDHRRKWEEGLLKRR